jgi:hypothetical protein
MELVQRLRKQNLEVFALPLQQKEKAGRAQGSIWGYQFRADGGPMEVFQMCAWDALTVAGYGNKLFPETAQDFWYATLTLNPIRSILIMERTAHVMINALH